MPKTDTSAQYFETKLSQNPQSLVFSRLADCYRKNGEIQQAIGVCMEGLKSHPDYVTGRVILGRCYLEQEKLKDAVAEFVKVVELDRRNQVAVKMIADIYSRQGMKEKAGDLYSFLLRMDPDNQSLHTLTSTFRGQGETSIQKILGIAGQTMGGDGDFGAQMPSDVIVDADRTIQMDLVSRQPEMRTQDTAEFGEMLVKTQQFDANELGAAAERAEELGAEATDKQGGIVTGDDISSRMAMMFGEGETPAAAAEPEVLEHVDIGTEHTLDHTEVASQARTTVKDDGVVSGSDISSRIEQLFGEEEKVEKTEAAAPEADYTQIFETQETAEETPRPAPKAPPPAAPIKELPRDQLRPVDSSEISGEDIASRLNEMFDETPAEAPLGQDTDIAPRPAVEIEETPVLDIAADIPAKSLTGATEEIKIDGAGKPPAAPVGDTGISGDDVAFRLETIFEEGEQAAGEDVAGTDVISVEEEDKPHPEEETKQPHDTSVDAIVIGGEDEGMEAASETIIAPAKRPAEQASLQETKPPAPAPAIDVSVPPEEEDASPGMSGDDVAGRLDELFSDSLIKDGDLKSSEAIPEGDKEDEVVNQGFYTMSGENAQTAESGDAMLSELDQVEAAVPEAETLDMAREPEEKTVLMDEDGGEDTMPAEEETIFSGARDPFLPQPPRAQVKIDKRDEDETVRAAAPTPGSDAVFNEKPIEEPGEEPEAGEPQAYSIPDHVLTPTLADIYYQQGQPQLALQIYRRLLSADPDNERMAKRIAEIERGLAAQEIEETVAMEHARKKARIPAAPVASKPEKKPKESEGPRPLAGVRIKKKFKAKIKKSK
jgi:tetratricopeptide (TPR) repeat protein